MKEELSAKDKEIEQLKYEMIDLSSRLTAESKKHREAVIQSTDRLQQLVAMQNEMELERRALGDDLKRLREFEEREVEVNRRERQAEKEKKELSARLEAVEREKRELKEQLEGKKSALLVQHDLNTALTTTLQQKTGEMDKLTRENERTLQRTEELASQLRLASEHNNTLSARNAELKEQLVQAQANEVGLNAEMETMRKECVQRREREESLVHEISCFVGMGGACDG